MFWWAVTVTMTNDGESSEVASCNRQRQATTKDEKGFYDYGRSVYIQIQFTLA